MEEECVICRSGGKDPCSKEGVCFRLTCLKCLEIVQTLKMFGETGRLGRKRCGEYEKALQDRENSNLWEHSFVGNAA